MTQPAAPPAPTSLLDELRTAAEHADLLAETNGSAHWREWAGRFRARFVRVVQASPCSRETCDRCAPGRLLIGPLPEARKD